MIKPRPGSWLALVLATAFAIYAPVIWAAGLGLQCDIGDHGQRRTLILATDELQVVGKRHSERIIPANDAQALRRQADALSRQLGKEVRLVLYAQGSARTDFTRRILTRDVLLHVEPGARPQALAQAYGA